MCGIAGFWSRSTGSAEELAHRARRMGDAMPHRGPDDAGVWCDASAGIALSHRRLAIQDLSPAGHQPMASASGRYQILFNGEIYNHLDLRAALANSGDAPAWRGHSDTETLLAAIETWGWEATLAQCVGMFAIALWDTQSRRLLLARDRLGEKPLYYGWQGDTLLFASELKALRAHPAFAASIDRHALALMTRYSYVPNPHCIYQGFRKLPPGHWLQLHSPDDRAGPQPYWSPWAALEAGFSAAPQSDAEAVTELENLLSRSVSEQCLSDVPLGALLSGGVDSSLIVALMQAQSRQRVRTFTIGFEDPRFNESAHAARVARHLGTEHTELFVQPQQALDLIPQLPVLFDEPLGDYSALPTTLVAQLARRQVTVALSGDGGDELFCGYTRYADTQRRAQLLRLPLALRKPLAQRLRAISTHTRLQRAADLLALPGFDALYDHTFAPWDAPVPGQEHAQSIPATPAALDPALDDWQRMMLSDLLRYLPEHILAKVDRAAMAASLETRAPLLDHRVVEFALRQPQRRKRRQGQSKWLLRQLLYRHVPRELIERPKMGFTVPIGQWLRGPLRDWAESLLDGHRLRSDGIFDAAVIHQRWQDYLDGDDRYAQLIWNVLIARQWLDAQAASPR